MGQREAPLILEIVKEEAATMKEEDGEMRDQKKRNKKPAEK